MPNSSLSTLASGPRQFVVHDALEMMFWLPSYLSSLTPSTMVMSSSLGRRGDDDLLGAGVQVALGLGGVGEDAGGLDDDVDAQVAPRQRGRAFLDLERLDLGAADDDGVVAFEADVLGVAAQDRVELQQVRQAGVVGEVVDRDDLDVGALALGLLRREGPVEVASDAAEAVNANPDGHLCLPFVALMLTGQRSAVRAITCRLVSAWPGFGRCTGYPAISGGFAAACRPPPARPGRR